MAQSLWHAYLVKAAEERLAVSIAVATGAQPAHAAPCLVISHKVCIKSTCRC